MSETSSKAVADDLEQPQAQAAAEQQTSQPENEEVVAVEAELVEDAPAEAETAEDPRIQALEQQLAELKEAFLREQADLENQRRRLKRDVENAQKFALERFVNELLPIKDSMEMGQEAAAKEDVEVEALREGGELIMKMMSSALEKFGIAEVPAEGEKFNPELHEAMSMVPVPGAEPNTVLMVHQKGYTLNGRLVRPARVIVAKAAD